MNGRQLKKRAEFQYITEKLVDGEKQLLEEPFIAKKPKNLEKLKKTNKRKYLKKLEEMKKNPEKYRLPEEDIKKLMVFKVCYEDHSDVGNKYQRRCTFFRQVPAGLEYLQDFIYVQYKGTDVFGDTYTKSRKGANVKTKEADIKMDPLLDKKINEMMHNRATDREIKKTVKDMNDPLIKTLKANQLKYRRRKFKEKAQPEEIG